MRLRGTLFFVLVLLGLGAYVYWVEVPKSQEEAKKKTLLTFKADDVTQLSLVYADREIGLKKTGNDWRLTKPIDAPADSAAVTNLLSSLAEAELKRSFDDGSALAQYGLDPPFVKVAVTANDKELPMLLVGKSAPVGYSAYAKKADDPKVLVTTAAFRAGLDKQPKDLRDKTIVNFADADVQHLEIHGAGKDLALARQDDRWAIERPKAYAADQVTVRSYLSSLRSLRAVDFASDQPADLHAYGLDAPRLKVSLSLGKDRAQKDLLIGNENDNKQVYLQGSGQPTVYLVSDWALRDLDKGVPDFRDKTLLSFDPDKVLSLEVARKDGGHFKLVRNDKQWRLEGAGESPISQTALIQYVNDLRALVGFEIAADDPRDLAPFGLAEPVFKVTVVGEGDKPVGTVLFGTRAAEAADQQHTAMTEGGHTVVLVRDYVFTRLDKRATDFVDKPTPTAGAAEPTPEMDVGADDFGSEPLGDEE